MDLPTTVLSAGNEAGDAGRDIWTAVNAEIASRSAAGIHKEVSGASHMDLVLDQRYAPVTAEAIVDMVTAVRGQ